MAKTGYRFNSETLSYDKIEKTLRKKILLLLKNFFSSLSLAVVIFFIVSAFIDSPKEKALRRENDELLARFRIMYSELEQLNGILKNLESRDDNIYRVIFESDPISPSIRRAGTGGVNKYESLKGISNSDQIIKTSKRLDELSKAIYIQSKSYDEVEELAKSKIEMMASIPAIVPISLKNKRNYISSAFGMRMHPLYKTLRFHAGMDFSGAIGTPIYATGNGTISKVELDKGYGKYIEIDHGFNYKTLYAHLNGYNVQVGQKIKRGDVIGYMGNTGVSIGPHVHYEVRRNSIPVDPINYYFNDLTPDEYEELVETANNTGQSMD